MRPTPRALALTCTLALAALARAALATEPSQPSATPTLSLANDTPEAPDLTWCDDPKCLLLVAPHQNQALQPIRTYSPAPSIRAPAYTLVPLGLAMLTGGVALMYVTSADDSNGHDQRWALSAGLTGAGAATLGAGLFAVGASGTQRQARTLGAILLPLGFASATGGFLGLFASTADQAPRAALRTEISAAMLASSALFLGGGTIALAVDGQRQRTLQASTHGPRFAGASLAPTAGGVMGHIGVEF